MIAYLCTPTDAHVCTASSKQAAQDNLRSSACWLILMVHFQNRVCPKEIIKRLTQLDSRNFYLVLMSSTQSTPKVICSIETTAALSKGKKPMWQPMLGRVMNFAKMGLAPNRVKDEKPDGLPVVDAIAAGMIKLLWPAPPPKREWDLDLDHWTRTIRICKGLLEIGKGDSVTFFGDPFWWWQYSC